MKINKTTFRNDSRLKNTFFIITLAFITISSNTYIYADTQLAGFSSNSSSESVFVPSITPIFTEQLREVSVIPRSSDYPKTEYHTYPPGNEPAIYLWTIFPGPKSNVNSPTIVKSLLDS